MRHRLLPAWLVEYIYHPGILLGHLCTSLDPVLQSCLWVSLDSPGRAVRRCMVPVPGRCTRSQVPFCTSCRRTEEKKAPPRAVVQN